MKEANALLNFVFDEVFDNQDFIEVAGRHVGKVVQKTNLVLAKGVRKVGLEHVVVPIANKMRMKTAKKNKQPFV